MQIQSGTASVTLGDNNIIASTGVDWSDVTPGCVFAVVGGVLYTVATTEGPGTSASGFWEVNLSGPYEGMTNAAASYAIHKDFSPVWGFPMFAPGDIETANLINRAWLSIEANLPAPSPTPQVTVVKLASVAALKAILTPALPLLSTFWVSDSTTGDQTEWTLTSGVHADDVPGGYAQPDDYDSVTNARYYVMTS